MSNISVNTITDASGGSTASINGLTPQASNMQPFNRIINGAMTIDQRNAGAAVTLDGSTGYAADRYSSTEIGDGAFTLQQVTDAPAGFANSLKMTVTTPQTGTLNAGISQSIEGLNISDLGWGTVNAKTVTLSFWVKSSVTGSMGGAIQNSAQDRSYPFNYTINTANTWEYKTITIAGDTSGTWLVTNGTGIILRFMFGTSVTGAVNTWAGANYRSPTGSVFPITTSGATFYITGVQLEAGSTASSFAHENYGDTLQKCQRYYEVGSGRMNIYSSLGSNYPLGVMAGTGFQVAKRSAPTVTLGSATASGCYANSGGTENITTASFSQVALSLAAGSATYCTITQPWIASIEL
jgi:hypothetical protein